MSDCGCVMTFPETVEEFMEDYKIVDTEHVYTNGVKLVPIFRMKQWFDAHPQRKKGKWETKMIDVGFFDADVVVCSECKDIIDIAWRRDSAVKYFKFCPFCGAEMRGEANEAD